MITGRFARHQRLGTPAEFKRVFDQPVKRSDKALTLLCRTNGKSYARLGLAVPKRQIKTAVGRNRVKRLVRESFRRHQGLLVGWDIVVLARFAATKIDNQTFLQRLGKHWQAISSCEKS